MKAINVYEDLYNKMKNNYIVVNDNREYSLGNYMRMRADQKSEASNLPAVRSMSSSDVIVSSFFKYVNDKLTLKSAPAKDKTIRRFPLRTVLSSAFCAFIMCAVMVCYGVIGMKGGIGSDSIVNEPKYEYSEEYTDTLVGYDEYNDIF